MGKERDNNRERFRDALCPMGVVLRGSALHSRTDYMAFSDSDHGLALKALVNGDSAAQGGAFAAAIIHYKDAIRLRPDYAEAYYKVGCALAEIEDFDGSIRSFDEYIRLQPQDPNGYLCRGRVFCDRREYGRAISEYSRAIVLRPGYARAYDVRGRAYHEEAPLKRPSRTMARHCVSARGTLIPYTVGPIA